jgi:hypothetical protein
MFAIRPRFAKMFDEGADALVRYASGKKRQSMSQPK